MTSQKTSEEIEAYYNSDLYEDEQKELLELTFWQKHVDLDDIFIWIENMAENFIEFIKEFVELFIGPFDDEQPFERPPPLPKKPKEPRTTFRIFDEPEPEQEEPEPEIKDPEKPRLRKKRGIIKRKKRRGTKGAIAGIYSGIYGEIYKTDPRSIFTIYPKFNLK